MEEGRFYYEKERENMQSPLGEFRAQEGKQTGPGGKAQGAGEQERMVELTRDGIARQCMMQRRQQESRQHGRG